MQPLTPALLGCTWRAAAAAVAALRTALPPLSPADNVFSDLGIWQEN